ncbi:phosphate acetyltransferase [Acidothermaceae bacterium B102]|nr:phosphate acetyltransferase [Acidothermaceae bacterium B102]
MTHTILVVPTGHGVGLTATCLGLVRALDRLGMPVAFAKPLAQPGGLEADGPEPSTALIRLATHLDPPEPIAVSEVEALLSVGAMDQLMEAVVALTSPLSAGPGVLVVEGLVPGQGHQMYASRVNLAMAKALDASVLLVGAPEGNDDQDRALDELAENMAIAASTYRAGEDIRVIGSVVNRVDPASLGKVGMVLAAHGLHAVGAVPLTPAMSRLRVLDLARALGAKALNEGEWGTRRIHAVSVCAQSVPGVLSALTDGRLVVTPGDRLDVVMATCLKALGGVRLAALLLTAGIEPDSEVWQLTEAARATGLPILLVDEPTYETANAVYALSTAVAADDAERAETVMRTVADHLDEAWIRGLVADTHERRLSPAAFRYRITTAARAAHKTIVLPEGAEPRTLHAAVICAERGLAHSVLLAKPDEIAAQARLLGLTLPPGVTVLDPESVAERYVAPYVELRKHKGATEDIAREQLSDTVVLGTMMLKLDEVDGLVAGAVHTTAHTLRPALQLIKTAPGAALVSSVFFMLLPDEVIVYGDCAVNPNPTADELADIALQSAASARQFGIEPRVAMLSYSTGGSGSGSDVDRVAEATRLARERAPGLAIDGPLQYDAAAIASVAKSKRPDSPVAGRATVFVFPDLNTGNTTYKAVQRGADVISIGPMLQGLAKPVNDLSRGALVEDIVYTIAVTAIQAAAT